MRKSGDPNTSVGNSLINALAHLFTFAKLYAEIHKMDVMDVEPKHLNSYFMVIGDDNLGMIPLMFQQAIEEGKLDKILKQLGFKAKSKLRKGFKNTEFCSGRLWQIDDNEWCLGPKPARWWARHAISLSLPVNAGSDLKATWLKENIKATQHVGSFVPGIGNTLEKYLSILPVTDIDSRALAILRREQ